MTALNDLENWRNTVISWGAVLWLMPSIIRGSDSNKASFKKKPVGHKYMGNWKNGVLLPHFLVSRWVGGFGELHITQFQS